MRRCFLLLTVALLAVTNVAAQKVLETPEPTEIVLGDVKASLEKESFIIDYQIALGEQVKECDIKLYMSWNGGEVYYGNPLEIGISGDVGKIRRSGGKRISYEPPRELLRNMAGRQVVFKIVVSNIKYKDGSVSVGTPSVVRWDNTELIVSLPVEVSSKDLLKWKGICYSDQNDSPTFKNSEVKRFMEKELSDNATMSLPIVLVPGKTYYVRGFAVRADNGATVYGETIKFTVPSK